jgi:hypothetical protein
MTVIDFKKKLNDKILADLRKHQLKAPRLMAQKKAELEAIVSSLDDLDMLVNMTDEMFMVLQDQVYEFDEVRRDIDTSDSASLARLYFGCMLATGKIEATLLGVRQLMSRIEELEPKIMSEHLNEMVSTFKPSQE